MIRDWWNFKCCAVSCFIDRSWLGYQSTCTHSSWHLTPTRTIPNGKNKRKRRERESNLLEGTIMENSEENICIINSVDIFLNSYTNNRPISNMLWWLHSFVIFFLFFSPLLQNIIQKFLYCQKYSLCYNIMILSSSCYQDDKAITEHREVMSKTTSLILSNNNKRRTSWKERTKHDFANCFLFSTKPFLA